MHFRLSTGDPFSPSLKKGLLLALPGAVVISWGDFALGWSALWGNFLALQGSFFAALYILFGRKVRPRISLGSYVTLKKGPSPSSGKAFLAPPPVSSNSPRYG